MSMKQSCRIKAALKPMRTHDVHQALNTQTVETDLSVEDVQDSTTSSNLLNSRRKLICINEYEKDQNSGVFLKVLISMRGHIWSSIRQIKWKTIAWVCRTAPHRTALYCTALHHTALRRTAIHHWRMHFVSYRTTADGLWWRTALHWLGLLAPFPWPSPGPPGSSRKL